MDDKNSDVKQPQEVVIDPSTVNKDVKNISEDSSTTGVEEKKDSVSSPDSTPNAQEETHTIPYDRFKEINEKKNYAEMKVKELQEDLENLKVTGSFKDEKLPRNKKDLIAIVSHIAKEQNQQAIRENHKNEFLKKINVENKYDAEKIIGNIEGIADAIVKSGQTDNYAEALDMAYYVRSGGKQIDERIAKEKAVDNQVKSYGIGGGSSYNSNTKKFTDADREGMKKWGMTPEEWEKYSD